jgi:Zn-dependent protease with chaperone function
MPTAGDVDLDFSRYIALRRGAADKRSRDGAAYAYTGEYRVRRALSAAKPVTIAIEATVRLWKSVAKAELLGTSVKVTDQQFPRLYRIAAGCAETLGIPTPTIYVSPTIGELNAHTLGTDEDSYIVLNAALVDHLSDEELVAVIGHECGHIHNNHVVYSTALYYLSVAASFYVRWIVQPAVLALRAWSRRAEITCDRAALLCTKDLDVTTAAIVKLGLGSEKLYKELRIDEYLKQLDEGRRGFGRVSEYFRSHPYLPKRVEALRLFARSSFYRRFAGVPLDAGGEPPLDAADVDAKVAELVAVL